MNLETQHTPGSLIGANKAANLLLHFIYLRSLYINIFNSKFTSFNHIPTNIFDALRRTAELNINISIKSVCLRYRYFLH